MSSAFDVIVVGAGHAGIEAAAAAARIGCRAALVTGNLDTIALMSCNPAMGGLAKGQLVREIDALGGLMARATDVCGIHFRILGRSKGPAMWSPRAQCDKRAYTAWVKGAIEACDGVFPLQGEVVDLMDDQGRITGVVLADGRRLAARAVVLTTGTFLNGLIHQGQVQMPGGRLGDHAATRLSAALQRLGLPLRRMKTGTPPRIHAASIDYACCEEQPGDDDPRPFSFATGQQVANRISCWTCHSEPAAHAIIRANRDRAPLFNGQIASIGPRYCPSIEDKVMRFADRERHQLHLEPEGLQTREVYVNGLSTSLPIDVQDQVLAAIPALRRAHVLRYGYAIEYDMVPSSAIDHRLAVIAVPGLYLAGQINGTSGYEEAAFQGLVAGANAALALAGREPLLIGRDQAYGGVMIDDLVHRVPDEPYRMFTSRAEYRLLLRSDNADRRLVPLAHRCGLVDDDRAAAVAAKQAAISVLVQAVPPRLRDRIAGEGLDLAATTALVPALAGSDPAIAEGAWIELRYAAYVARQCAQVARLERQRALPLAPDLDYATVPGLSTEARQALVRHRPPTLAAAGALPGLRPADIEQLWAWLQRRG